jgi:flagellar capping protein FliD
MPTMRESWTDERLDDLNERVSDGFRRVDRRFDRVDRRFDKMDERFDAMQRTMVGSAGLVIAALIGLIATQL